MNSVSSPSRPWLRARSAIAAMSSGKGGLADQDRRADRHARIQVDDVGDAHPDAAVRRAGADRVLRRGAVDADAAGDPEPARLQRILERPALDDLVAVGAGP